MSGQSEYDNILDELAIMLAFEGIDWGIFIEKTSRARELAIELGEYVPAAGNDYFV